jgi:hypothetical protein
MNVEVEFYISVTANAVIVSSDHGKRQLLRLIELSVSNRIKPNLPIASLNKTKMNTHVYYCNNGNTDDIGYYAFLLEVADAYVRDEADNHHTQPYG